jgi:transcriptional regulator with XRE-family HTH domain
MTMYPNLKLQLWKRGIRQNRLAQLLAIDETMLSKIINGFRQASPSIRQRIAAILECDEEWLFEGSDGRSADRRGGRRIQDATS